MMGVKSVVNAANTTAPMAAATDDIDIEPRSKYFYQILVESL